MAEIISTISVTADLQHAGHRIIQRGRTFNLLFVLDDGTEYRIRFNGITAGPFSRDITRGWLIKTMTGAVRKNQEPWCALKRRGKECRLAKMAVRDKELLARIIREELADPSSGTRLNGDDDEEEVLVLEEDEAPAPAPSVPAPAPPSVPAPAPAAAAAAAPATAAGINIGGAGTAADAQPAADAEEEDDDDADALGTIPADDDSIDTAIAPAGLDRNGVKFMRAIASALASLSPEAGGVGLGASGGSGGGGGNNHARGTGQLKDDRDYASEEDNGGSNADIVPEDVLGALQADDDSVDAAIAPAGRDRNGGASMRVVATADSGDMVVGSNTASDGIEVDQEAIAQRVLELLLEKGILDDVSKKDIEAMVKAIANRVEEVEMDAAAKDRCIEKMKKHIELLQKEKGVMTQGIEDVMKRVAEQEAARKRLEKMKIKENEAGRKIAAMK